jgi:hypothetical protein
MAEFRIHHHGRRSGIPHRIHDPVDAVELAGGLSVRWVVVLLLAGVFSPSANAEDLKDPTRPPIMDVPIKHNDGIKLLPHVSAIFVSSTRRIAIFNDQPVRAGDRVGAYLIDEVNARGVRYSNAGHSAFAALDSTKASP